MRALLERDFERFRGGLPQDFASLRSRGVSHRPDRPLSRLHPSASDRQRLRPALAQPGTTGDRPRRGSRVRRPQDGHRRGCGRVSGHERLGDPRDAHEGRAGAVGLDAGRMDGDVEGQGVGPLVRRLPRAGARGGRHDTLGRDARGSVRQVSPAEAGRGVPRGRVSPYHVADRRSVGRGRAWRWRRTSRPPSPATRWRTSASGSFAGCGKCRG